MTAVNSALAIRLVYGVFFVLSIMCTKRAPYIVAQFMAQRGSCTLKSSYNIQIHAPVMVTWCRMKYWCLLILDSTHLKPAFFYITLNNFHVTDTHVSE